MAQHGRPILVAPDSFKGSFSADEVAQALAEGLATAGWQCDLAPLADGGEGTAGVLVRRLGGSTRTARVSGPLGRTLEGSFGLLADALAVVEVASASGLELVPEDERDAEAASSLGTGELILAALAAGAQHVLVAAGGSASTDGGAGAIGAITQGGGLREAKLTVLCDVRTPYELAAARFGPQKGADPEAVERLERRLARFASELPRDPRGLPLSGAAGGLAGGLWAAFDAALRPGAPFVLETIGFDKRLRSAHAVVVGEGRLDATTLDGKAVAEAATRARQLGVPAHAIVGSCTLDPFDQRILDIQTITEATSREALVEAAARLGRLLRES